MEYMKQGSTFVSNTLTNCLDLHALVFSGQIKVSGYTCRQSWKHRFKPTHILTDAQHLGNASDATKQFLANTKNVILSLVDLPLKIKCYRDM